MHYLGISNPISIHIKNPLDKNSKNRLGLWRGGQVQISDVHRERGGGGDFYAFRMCEDGGGEGVRLWKICEDVINMVPKDKTYSIMKHTV